MVAITTLVAPSGECYKVKAGMVCMQCNSCVIYTCAFQRRASHNGALYRSSFLSLPLLQGTDISVPLFRLALKSAVLFLTRCCYTFSEDVWVVDELSIYHFAISWKLMNGCLPQTPWFHSLRLPVDDRQAELTWWLMMYPPADCYSS